MHLRFRDPRRSQVAPFGTVTLERIQQRKFRREVDLCCPVKGLANLSRVFADFGRAGEPVGVIRFGEKERFVGRLPSCIIRP